MKFHSTLIFPVVTLISSTLSNPIIRRQSPLYEELTFTFWGGGNGASYQLSFPADGNYYYTSMISPVSQKLWFLIRSEDLELTNIPRQQPFHLSNHNKWFRWLERMRLSHSLRRNNRSCGYDRWPRILWSRSTTADYCGELSAHCGK